MSSRWIPRSTAYTLYPENGSLGEGAIDPPYTGDPSGSVYDSASNQVLFGDDSGFNVTALNGSTGSVAALRYLPNQPWHWSEFSLPDVLAYNPKTNIIYVEEDGTNAISFLNGTTDTILRVVRDTNPLDLATDPRTGDLYVGHEGFVQVINGSTGSPVTNISTAAGAYCYSMTFDPEGHNMWAALDVSGLFTPVDVINDTNYVITSNFTVSEGDLAQFAYDPLEGKMFATGAAPAGAGWVLAMNASPAATSPVLNETQLPWDTYYIAFNPDIDVLYVANGAYIYMLDAQNCSLLRTIPFAPATLTYDPQTHLLFTIDIANAHIALFDGWNNTLIRSVPYYHDYLTGALNPDNGEVYIASPMAACNQAGSLTVLAPDPHPRVLETLPVGNAPSGVAYDPTDHRVFVTNYCSDDLTVVNSTSNTELNQTIPVGSEPYGIAFDPLHDALFVANHGSHNVTELNASSFAVLHTYTLPSGVCPYAIGVVPGLEQVYVTNACGSNISVLNASSQSVVTAGLTTGYSSQGVVYDPQNRLVYVANTDANTITYLAASNRTVLGTISVSNGPTGLAFDPADQLLFAADATGSRVSVIDTTTNVPAGPTLPASLDPEGVVYVPASHQVDVFSFGAGVINILANAPTVVSAPTVPNPTEVGVRTLLGVVAQNGTGSYSFSYGGLPPGCATLNVSFLLCRPTQAGTFPVTVTVTDSVGYAGWEELLLVVVPPPRVSEFSVVPGVIDLGSVVEFEANAVSELPALSYTYSGLPPGCPSVNTSAFSCRPSASGTFLIEATVTDALGGSANYPALLVVYPPLQLVAFLATLSSPEVGGTVELEAAVEGGTVPYSFAYAGLPAGCRSANVSRLSCAPTSSGNFSVLVSVTDAVGETVVGGLSLSVLPLPRPLPLQALVSYSVADGCEGGMAIAAVALSGAAAGGTAPYRFSWTLPTGTATGAATNVTIDGGTTATVTLTVLDATGANATVTEHIVPPAGHCAIPASTVVGSPGVSVAELALLGIGALLLGVLGDWAGRQRFKMRRTRSALDPS